MQETKAKKSHILNSSKTFSNGWIFLHVYLAFGSLKDINLSMPMAHNSLCFIVKLHRFFLHPPSLLLTKFKGPPISRKRGEKEEREAIRLCLLQQQQGGKRKFFFPLRDLFVFFCGKGGGEGRGRRLFARRRMPVLFTAARHPHAVFPHMCNGGGMRGDSIRLTFPLVSPPP